MSDFWAIACYFNPMGYARRRANYERFREQLDVPLLTVAVDADADIRVPRAEVLWQKERLLNLAVQALPAACTKAAWLDCDVVFPDADWAARASELLDRVPLVQLFRGARYLDRDGAVARTRPSLVSGIADGLAPEACLEHPAPDQRPGTYACGLGWAARRELLDAHGLYDRNIIGGGDRAIACAAYGCYAHEIAWHDLTAPQQRAYLAWAEPFHRAVDGAVAHLDVELHHMWHGDVADRRFGHRHAGLAEFAFDPAADIAIDEHGAWRWSSDKPALHAYVRDYFAARTEDG